MKTKISGSTIVVTGGAGFLGKHVVKKLKLLKPKKIIIPRSKDCDLRNFRNCLKVTKNSDFVIHMAGNVGGIGYNQKHPAELFDDNILMGVNIMRAARQNKIKKFVAVGTVCSYPKFAHVPFKEVDLWSGYPEETNAPYGLAKKMLLVQAQAYRQEYNFNAIYLLPVNLYGIGDNFDPESSHVIPSLIKKFIDARDKHSKDVVVWGTGRATREFLYVEEAAEGIVNALQNYDKADPVNLGSSYEISIANLAKTISKIVGYKGEIIFDSTKPDGQPRRKLDTTRAFKEFGFKSKIDFRDGLTKTINWYEQIFTKKTKKS